MIGAEICLIVPKNLSMYGGHYGISENHNKAMAQVMEKNYSI